MGASANAGAADAIATTARIPILRRSIRITATRAVLLMGLSSGPGAIAPAARKKSGRSPARGRNACHDTRGSDTPETRRWIVRGRSMFKALALAGAIFGFSGLSTAKAQDWNDYQHWPYVPPQ